jgi:two-component system sensor histidine kinase UhpB
MESGTARLRGPAPFERSTIGNVHRDFHTEPEINGLRGFPFHKVSFTSVSNGDLRSAATTHPVLRHRRGKRDHHETHLMIFMSPASLHSKCMGAANIEAPMKLRTRLNLVMAGLTAAFVIVLIAAEIQATRSSIREEIEAANRVASQLLGRLALIYSSEGGPELVLPFLEQVGHVRANDLVLRSTDGHLLYHSPPPTYKAGREAPAWFAQLMSPAPAKYAFSLPGGVELSVEANSSRAVLDAWDDLTRLFFLAAAMLVIFNGLAFWSVDRALAPFPVITDGLERVQQGDLAFRLPPFNGFEARAIGAAFNRMAQAVQDKVQVEKKAHEAETRLDERREMALLVEQRVEEERRLIAHELHDEFGQSVTAIRSLAIAIATQVGERDPPTGDAARLISEEAARLYDAMHGLIPRLTPLSLDTLGLADSLENLVRDWQRRNPAIKLSLEHDLSAPLGPSVTLAIYRVVQEGLINALRHAQASRVAIDVQSDAQRIVVTVSDDGIGMPPQGSQAGRFGLRGLSERVAHLGGIFNVSACEPHGVRLTAQIPLATSA